MKNKGWIRLHRKIMEGPDWLAEPFTRSQAWIDLLLLANHKTGHIRKRGILIKVKRGQVGYSEAALAARWRWSRGKVSRFLRTLRVNSQISRNPVQQNPRLSSLITITNYDHYQSSSTTSSTTNGQQTVQGTKNDKNDKKEKPPDFFSLKNRYQDPDLIDKVFQAIASTRKSGKVKESVLLAQLQKWERYPVEQVLAAIRIYLEKDCAGQGKREEYLLGIIKGQKVTQKQPDAKPPKILTPEEIEAMKNAN